MRTRLGIYGQIYPSAFRSSLGLRPRELLQAEGDIWPYIPPLVLIQIQYTCIISFKKNLHNTHIFNIGSQNRPKTLPTCGSLISTCSVIAPCGPRCPDVRVPDARISVQIRIRTTCVHLWGVHIYIHNSWYSGLALALKISQKALTVQEKIRF